MKQNTPMLNSYHKNNTKYLLMNNISIFDFLQQQAAVRNGAILEKNRQRYLSAI